MKRVLLVVSSTLFGQGMKGMLRQEAGLEVRCCEADVNLALENVRSLQPDVVVVEHREPDTSLRDALGQMLQACEQIKVIVVDPQDDTIHIYTGQQQVIREAKDLMEAIEQAVAR